MEKRQKEPIMKPEEKPQVPTLPIEQTAIPLEEQIRRASRGRPPEHPDDPILAETIETVFNGSRELAARYFGVELKHVNEIIRLKRPLTAEMIIDLYICSGKRLDISLLTPYMQKDKRKGRSKRKQN